LAVKMIEPLKCVGFGEELNATVVGTSVIF